MRCRKLFFLITSENVHNIYNVTDAYDTKQALDTFNKFYAWSTEKETNKKYTDRIALFLMVNTAKLENGIYKFEF